MKPLAIIQAPSSLGLTNSGVAQLGDALLRLGLAKHLAARVVGRVAPAVKNRERDPATGILNLESIVGYTPRVAKAVGASFDAGEFPFVLGGDCTILLGPMLALRRRGRFGLLFIDGHADYFQPEAEPNGEGASMELAWVTGKGPDQLTEFEGYRPLVRAEDVGVLGYRDHEDQEEAGSQPLDSRILSLDLPAISRTGIERATNKILERLTADKLDGFFIHLDADVLNDEVMPAVDFRTPGGLELDEVVTVLRLALSTGRAVGMDVTIYNPDLDPNLHAGRVLVELLAAAFDGKVANTPEATASR